jgi:hypothetical protein
MRVASTHYQQGKEPAGPAFHLICCLTYTLLCLGWSVWAGRDQSWDQLNYHLYVAQAWWQNRLPEELFAASSQGYLNPLAHLPFFAAYSTGWNSILITITVAALHSTNLWLLHFIAVELTPPSNRLRRLMVFCGVVLGGLTPAFLIELGASFTDVVISIPSLAALLCLLHWIGDSSATPLRQSWRLLYLAGLLAGVSMGLKPSALVFCGALALAAIVLAPSQRWSVLWRTAASGLAGLTLTGGPHAFMLWQNFGNPVFPLFNSLFASPWFPVESVVSDRFRPESLMVALRYPLDLADAFQRPGFEGIAVDIRPIWLIGALILITVLHKFSRARAGSSDNEGSPAPKLFWLTLLIFMPAWLYSSGNTRYAIQALLLLGPGLAWAALRIPGRSDVWPLLVILAPMFAQGTVSLTLNAVRHEKRAWTESWFDLEMPDKLRTQPAYYISLQLQSFSSLSAELPPASRFINVIGQNTLNPAGLVWTTVRQRQQRIGLPWRTLYLVPTLAVPNGVPLSNLDVQDALLSEYGLQLQRNDCQWLILDGKGKPALHWQEAGPRDTYSFEMERSVIISCAVTDAPPMPAEEAARRKNIDERMAWWTQHCPAYFAPAEAWSEQMPRQRRRFFASTETLLLESGGQLITAKPGVGGNVTILENAQQQHLQENCPEMPPRGRTRIP